MIPRITKGTSARAALAYDFGAGRCDEHVNPRTVAGNLPGDWRDQAAVLDGHAALTRPDVAQPVWRSSLRAAADDRTLSDEEWRQAAQTYIQRMGFEDAPWTATRHGDDHIHLTVSRVRWDGKLTDINYDHRRAQDAARAVEREHGLVDASTRYDRARPQVSHGERESAQRRGVPAERDQLRERVREATGRSDGTLDSFDQQLQAQGVLYKRNQASTGRVSGYSYALPGHQDATGAQVWFKGSSLGQEHRWTQTQKQLDARAVEVAAGPAYEHGQHPETRKVNDMDRKRSEGRTDPGPQPDQAGQAGQPGQPEPVVQPDQAEQIQEVTRGGVQVVMDRIRARESAGRENEQDQARHR